MSAQFKVDRQIHHDQFYFEQFDNFTLAAMSFNLTDDAYDELTHTQDLRLDADTAWDLAASIANANMALRVLVLRLSSESAEARAAGESPMIGETLQ
ncbi:hypothetical protein H7A76_06430 [Pseudomonas sp. MSSRFD41]|uniref:hypothetical protein n=1 Tax=Pseudomonas sp. MSSRFD41 TaxID=1310370 RepID=UPI00163B269E|nr:hypothetical protein [Pseudomonas sp. MSSRFD41]MBC2655072.1 hypothetical protein [Pseudomonas sp. MSSRFD41]